MNKTTHNLSVAAIVVISVLSVYAASKKPVSQDTATPVMAEAEKSKLQIDKPIRVGVFPRRSYKATKKAFTPFVDHLAKELGAKVELVLFKDFKNFWKRLEDKEFDVVHFNQYHYVKAHKEIGYNVIVSNEEFGKRDIAGAISVRTDSGINTVEDLRGKVISFGGGPKAMGSYIAPTSILKKHGLVAGKDYTVNFALSPPKSLINTFSKIADANGSGDVVIRLKVVKDKVDVSQIKQLAASERFVQLPWAVVDTMAKPVADRIKEIMVTLQESEEGKAVLKSARVTGFFEVQDANFTKIREIVKYTLDESYFDELASAK